MPGPTNPTDKVYPVDNHWSESITKREYFAGLAMQGFLASWAGSFNDPDETLMAKNQLLMQTH